MNHSADKSDSTRVLLVDDDPFTLTVVAAMLRGLGCDVVSEETSAAGGLQAAQRLEPDAAVLDLDLGEGPTGIDVAQRLRAMLPDIGIVVLSTYEEPRLMGYNQPPLPEGSIYLVKRTVTDPGILERAIAVSLDPEARAIALPVSGAHVASKMTDLQIDLMRMVAIGHSNAEIARLRSLTVPSAEKAIARLIKQLGLQATPAQNQRVLIAQMYYQLTGAVSTRRA
ncbi:unannotated protein [freshwater metagenome]|uniref:Unannotated protein n=1 Tax=freshwater metagenome TaxID=449393 RepID=A0A6J7GWL2_9ZZZZ|nr:response regulator [Actinomycetota bacterium]